MHKLEQACNISNGIVSLGKMHVVCTKQEMEIIDSVSDNSITSFFLDFQLQ